MQVTKRRQQLFIVFNFFEQCGSDEQLDGDMSLSLRSSGKETSRGGTSQEELSPLEDFTDDEDMETLISKVWRKKLRLKHPGDELSMEFSNERTERTPLLKGKTSLRPQQRSLSKSL